MIVRGWLSVKQAAQELDVTPEAIYQLVTAGRLEDWKAGEVRLIRRADLERYKAGTAGKQRPGPKPAAALAVAPSEEIDG